MGIANLFDTNQITLKKYMYGGLIALRGIIGLHVFYLYASSFGGSHGAKGGTFLETTTSTITFLPYASAKDDDKLYQHLLFQSCQEPSFSGSNINYGDGFCDISTDDYQTFSVSVPANYTRSDGEPLTIEDVYFTYVTVLTENIRNLPYLEKYQNITSQVNGSELIFTFPSSSIDNMSFFTNFVLPQHVLANKEYDWYTSTFANTIINSTCVQLQTDSNDDTSAIFDLSQCEDFLLKYFQVKYFDDTGSIVEYSQDKSGSVDMIHSPIDIQGFQRTKYITNKFSTIFFNTRDNSLSQAQRSYLAKLFIHASGGNPDIALDQFIFNALEPRDESQPNSILEETQPEIPEETINDRAIPEIITLSQDEPIHQYEYLQTINNNIPLSLSFAKPYQTITISHNGGLLYTPESYNATDKKAVYNLNPTFRNIVPGENIYTVNGISEERTDIFEIKIQYLDEAENEQKTAEEEEEADTKKRKLIYFSDELNTTTIKVLKQTLENYKIDQFFEFVGYDNTDELDGTISAGDFDMVIRTLDMGLRRDLSNIFVSDDRYINPSGYTNQEMAELVQAYFISGEQKQNRVKDRLDILYTSNVPFVILGKKLESYLIHESFEESPFPERLYVMGWRKPYIKDISLVTNTSIDRSEVFQRKNLIQFIQDL